MNPYLTPLCPGCREPMTRDHHFRRRLLFSLLLCVGFALPTIARATEPSIIITRAAVEEKSDHEWIEIENQSEEPVDLTGWKFFEDDVNHKLTVVAGDATLAPNERAVIADVADVYRADHPDFVGTLFDSSWDSLSETGEEIALKDATGLVVTTFWTGPAAIEEPTVTTSTPPQSPAPVPQIAAPVPTTTDFRFPPPRVVISELFSNPTDADADEWIELQNLGGIPASVGGWILTDGTTRFKLPAVTIDAGMYAVFERRATNIALRNSGKETIELLNSDGDRADRVQYDAKKTAGLAFARLPDGSFEWTVHPTPHGSNDYEAPNRPPQIVIDGPHEVTTDEITIFDATDSMDPNHDDIIFAWTIEGAQFGPGPTVEYQFLKQGKQKIVLTATDGRGARTTDEFSVLVRGNAAETTTPATPKKEKEVAVTKKLKNKSATTHAVEGIVTALPGTTNKRILLVQTDDEETYEVYQNKAAFPTIELGDRIKASGRISESDAQRLIVPSAAAITISGHGDESSPAKVSVAGFDDVARGAFVAVEGEVVEVFHSGVTVDDDTGELLIAKPRAGWPLGIAPGARLTASGILLKQPSGTKLIPRTTNDIKIIASSTLAVAAPNGQTTAHRTLPHPAVPLLATALGALSVGALVRRLRPVSVHTRSPP